jgi:hypothetical protein
MDSRFGTENLGKEFSISIGPDDVVVRAGDNVATIETSARPKPTTSISHIAIAKSLDGKVVEWMNNGSDEQHEPKT